MSDPTPTSRAGTGPTLAECERFVEAMRDDAEGEADLTLDVEREHFQLRERMLRVALDCVRAVAALESGKVGKVVRWVSLDANLDHSFEAFGDADSYQGATPLEAINKALSAAALGGPNG